MQYYIKATVNYPETETDTPDHIAEGRVALLKWMHQLLEEPDATSFVVTIVKGRAQPKL